MCKAFRYLLFFTAGFFSGQLVVQALLATMLRDCSTPGGELLILPAIPLILWCGYTFGRDAQQHHAYQKGYEHGYEEAQHDRKG